MQALDDDDKAGIEQTIDDEILKRSKYVPLVQADAGDGSGLREGDLTLIGANPPARVRRGHRRRRHARGRGHDQADHWGMKPYTTLFGALKVVDEVTITLDAGLPRRPGSVVYTACASSPPSTPGGSSPVPCAYSATSAIVAILVGSPPSTPTHAPFDQVSVSGAAPELHAREQLRLVADLSVARAIAAGAPPTAPCCSRDRRRSDRCRPAPP